MFRYREAPSTARPKTWTDPRERTDRPPTIQLPPLSSSRTGPPQMTRSAGCDTHDPETAAYGPQKEDTTGRSRRPRKVDGYPPGLTPRNLVQNLSQGPIIHRPHPHPKQQRLREFLAPSRPPAGRKSGTRPPPGPERTAARSVGGKQPFKYETTGAPYRGEVFRDPTVCEEELRTSLPGLRIPLSGGMRRLTQRRDKPRHQPLPPKGQGGQHGREIGVAGFY